MHLDSHRYKLEEAPICKNLGLCSAEAGECLIAVKRKDRLIILKVFFIIIEQAVR